jgi:hypothetical protein
MFLQSLHTQRLTDGCLRGAAAFNAQAACVRVVGAGAARAQFAAEVAQLVEHLFCKQAVRGSSPLPSSIGSVVSSSVIQSAALLGKRGGGSLN